MEPSKRDLQQVRREVETLILQFEQVADFVEEIEYDREIINVREFFQLVISRYQLKREENAARHFSKRTIVPGIDLRGARILTIEDNEDISTLLALILEGSGAEVTSLSSAPKAMDLLQSESFAVVVSDIGMPEMSGLEFMRRLRACGGSVPSIALSAYSTNDDKQAALDAGFDLFVAKPVHPAKLVAGVSRLIAGEKA